MYIMFPTKGKLNKTNKKRTQRLFYPIIAAIFGKHCRQSDVRGKHRETANGRHFFLSIQSLA